MQLKLNPDFVTEYVRKLWSAPQDGRSDCEVYTIFADSSVEPTAKASTLIRSKM